MTLMATPPPLSVPTQQRGLGRVSTRPSTDADSAFLLDLFVATAEEELADLGWCLGDQRTFVIMQAQTREWNLIRLHATLDRLTICVDNVPVGRLLISFADPVVHVVDVCVIPSHRGRAVGTRLISELLAEAAVAQMPVRVRVPKLARSLRFFERLGFGDPRDLGNDWLLTFTPPAHDQADSTYAEHGHRGGARATPPVRGHDLLA